MPLYEFVCGKCHAEFETLVRGEEKPHCPKCDSQDLKKLLSVSATPSISSGMLPTMGCGKPQCGMGGCGGM
ncbi:MAG: FmdB family zinc ribbon protein [Planctomycetaceae bacterium]